MRNVCLTLETKAAGVISSSRQYALSVASISGAVINLIVILILGYLYEIIAYKLTQWGNDLSITFVILPFV